MSFPSGSLFYSLTSATGTPTGTTADLSGIDVDTPPVMQIIISATATVLIEQSLDQSNWATMKSITTSDSYVLPVQGLYYRARVTASTGTVSAIVGPGAAFGSLASISAPMTKSSGPV